MALSLPATRGLLSKQKLSLGDTFFYVTPLHSLKMSSTMSLNTRVHIVSKSGKKESITARELLARGTGSSFEAFQMLDDYERLAEDYAAELAAAAAVAAEQQDREDHLPHGAHLLPQDYQDFLYSWNKTISTTPGCRSWNGLGRDIYKINNKEAWKQWVAKNKEFRMLYAAEVAQVIAYQASHPIEEEDADEPDSMPSLPPSPIAVAEQPDADDVAVAEAEAEAVPEAEAEAAETIFQEDLSTLSGQQLRDIWAELTGRPKGLKHSGKLYNKQLIIQQIQLLRQTASEPEELCSSCNYRNTIGRSSCYMCGHASTQEAPADEQLEADGEDLAEQSAVAAAAAPELASQEPKKPHNPIYTNYKWPSPIAKVFVQHIRGRNAWNNIRFLNGNAWGDSTFRDAWSRAGNTEFRLTHDNCMRYLAYRMRLTLEDLMEKTPHEVHAKLIGDYYGVPGFYIKRSYY